MDVIASCVNCLIVLAARNPGKVGAIFRNFSLYFWLGPELSRDILWHPPIILPTQYLCSSSPGVVQSAPHRLPPLRLHPADQHGPVYKVLSFMTKCQMPDYLVHLKKAICSNGCHLASLMQTM